MGQCGVAAADYRCARLFIHGRQGPAGLCCSASGASYLPFAGSCCNGGSPYGSRPYRGSAWVRGYSHCGACSGGNTGGFSRAYGDGGSRYGSSYPFTSGSGGSYECAAGHKGSSSGLVAGLPENTSGGTVKLSFAGDIIFSGKAGALLEQRATIIPTARWMECSRRMTSR